MEFFVWTDGACVKNPGPGGWAAIVQAVQDGTVIREKELVGSDPSTTNNRMELTAICEGLMSFKEPVKVHVYSDSKYAIDPFLKGWIKRWKKHDLRTRPNCDLWHALDFIVTFHDRVDFHWVRGHNGSPLNERCDQLALKAARKAAVDKEFT